MEQVEPKKTSNLKKKERRTGIQLQVIEISEDMECEKEINARITIVKVILFCGSMNDELTKRLIRCFVWNVVLY